MGVHHPSPFSVKVEQLRKTLQALSFIKTINSLSQTWSGLTKKRIYGFSSQNVSYKYEFTQAQKIFLRDYNFFNCLRFFAQTEIPQSPHIHDHELSLALHLHCDLYMAGCAEP